MNDINKTHVDMLAVCMMVANTFEGWPPVGDLAAVASQARDEGSMSRLLAGRVTAAGDTEDGDEAALASREDPATRTPPPGPLSVLDFTRESLVRATPAHWEAAREFASQQIAAADAKDAHLSTILDGDFPSQMRVAGDVPFVFWAGTLDPERDSQSVAIEGSAATEECRVGDAEFVTRLVQELTAVDITVVARLEEGVGQQTLEMTLDAGGRGIAVSYSGLDSADWTSDRRKELTELARRLTKAGGLVVSAMMPTQTWGTPGWSRSLFASEILSGIGRGVVIVRAQPDDTAQSARDFESFAQAHDISMQSARVTDIAARNRGAYSHEFLSARRTQHQARIAVRQGRQVLLREQIRDHLQWPNETIQAGQAIAFSDPADIVTALETQ